MSQPGWPIGGPIPKLAQVGLVGGLPMCTARGSDQGQINASTKFQIAMGSSAHGGTGRHQLPIIATTSLGGFKLNGLHDHHGRIHLLLLKANSTLVHGPLVDQAVCFIDNYHIQIGNGPLPGRLCQRCIQQIPDLSWCGHHNVAGSGRVVHIPSHQRDIFREPRAQQGARQSSCLNLERCCWHQDQKSQATSRSTDGLCTKALQHWQQIT
mmetsp:Transcript_46907/g.57618  ORF Transcript_46907/g.57618 Transcript_46907/m.57618 type:complete len:210 (-) Transcript_46907:250-879(-)